MGVDLPPADDGESSVYAFATGRYREVIPEEQWQPHGERCWMEVLTAEREARFEHIAVRAALSEGHLPALEGATFVGNLSYGGGSMQATYQNREGVWTFASYPVGVSGSAMAAARDVLLQTGEPVSESLILRALNGALRLLAPLGVP